MKIAGKIFIDSAIFIYLIEEHPVFFPVVSNLLEDALAKGATLATNPKP